jgi:effector-binding domain-containing protein
MDSPEQRSVTVEISETSAQPAAAVRGHAEVAELPAFLGSAFDAALRVLSEQRLTPAGPPFARYRLTGSGFDVEAGFPATGAVRAGGPVVPTELPGGTIATALHRGSYETLGVTYDAVRTWLDEHGYESAADPWESYLDGPEVAEPRTLVSFPCRRR